MDCLLVRTVVLYKSLSQTDNTHIQVTANTDTDIISATITPTSSSNKILISISVDACRSYVSGNNRARLINKILRGSTLVHDIYGLNIGV